jgi:hypothetical protein
LVGIDVVSDRFPGTKLTRTPLLSASPDTRPPSYLPTKLGNDAPTFVKPQSYASRRAIFRPSSSRPAALLFSMC